MVSSHHWIDISGEKSYWGWGGVGCVARRIIVSAPVLVPFLRTLNLGLWIWDLDLGLGFGTGLGLDKKQNFAKKSKSKKSKK